MIPTFSNVITKANYNAAVQEARTLYTAYIASTAETGTTDKDFIIKVDTAKYIAVANGELQISAECTYATYTAASNDLVEADANNTWGVKYTAATTHLFN